MSDHPISTTYLDRQIARVSAVLPLLSAFDAAPLELYCYGFSYVTVYVTYTEGIVVGGIMHMKAEVSPDTTGVRWNQFGLYQAGGVVSGVESLSNVQREEIEYGATAPGDEKFVLGPLVLQEGSQRIRFSCQEVGQPLTPGTAQIIVIFG